MKYTIFFILFIVGILYPLKTVYSQDFTPQNGVAYNVNLDKWIQGGNDITATTRERLNFSIIFNTAYTDFTFGIVMGSDTTKIYNDGRMEMIRKALFSRPSVYASGTGAVERVGRSVKLTFQTEDGDVNEIEATIQ